MYSIILNLSFQDIPISKLDIVMKSNVHHQSTDRTDGKILLEWGDELITKISMDEGSNVMLIVDYGDGNVDKEFISNWTAGNVIQKHHGYAYLGFFDIHVEVRNSANVSTETAECAVYDNVKYIDFAIPNLATSGFLEVTFLRNDNATATLGTAITVEFGDDHAKITEDNFSMRLSFNHTYSKCGVYELSAYLNNPISSSRISEWISVIDKLEGVKIIINDEKEWLGIENEMLVEISANKGSNVTVEYNFGDGNPMEYSVGGEFIGMHSFSCG